MTTYILRSGSWQAANDTNNFQVITRTDTPLGPQETGVPVQMTDAEIGFPKGDWEVKDAAAAISAKLGVEVTVEVTIDE